MFGDGIAIKEISHGFAVKDEVVYKRRLETRLGRPTIWQQTAWTSPQSYENGQNTLLIKY